MIIEPFLLAFKVINFLFNFSMILFAICLEACSALKKDYGTNAMKNIVSFNFKDEKFYSKHVEIGCSAT